MFKYIRDVISCATISLEAKDLSNAKAGNSYLKHE